MGTGTTSYVQSVNSKALGRRKEGQGQVMRGGVHGVPVGESASTGKYNRLVKWSSNLPPKLWMAVTGRQGSSSRQ